MATLYTPAPAKARELVESEMDRHHPDLAEAKVKIGIVMAHAEVGDRGEIRRPAMVTKGRRVLGKIKINGLADRVDGKPDATMTLDGDHWDALEADGAEDEQRALVDHELTHLQLKRYPDVGERRGPVKLDTHQRPQLAMRYHDYELTGFDEVAERHGPASVEVQEATRWRDAHGNLLFSFANDLAETFRP